MSTTLLSIVIPVMNEESNIDLMISSLESHLKDINYEVIFVDDGSIDSTVQTVLKHKNKRIKLIEFTRNYGQTSAMAAGIEFATGEYIATLDGDLQNDPSDIIFMLEKIQNEKLDLLAGRRKKRKDGIIFRKIPSLIANYLIRKTSKTTIQDLGCSLKIFKASLAKKLDLYGELHRFIPILAAIRGAKIAEVDVKHHARQFGTSKYGISRTFRVLSDLFLMLFFIKYRQKPMHLFGLMGFGLLAIGSLIALYLLSLKFLGYDIGHRPLFFIDILCFITSLQFITTGFIAELLMRTYFAASKEKPYNINEIYIGGKPIKN
jgi:glycosyltransferase involved in cell wall biosynthesis